MKTLITIVALLFLQLNIGISKEFSLYPSGQDSLFSNLPSSEVKTPVDYNLNYPNFRIGLGLSSMSGSGITLAFAPVSLFKLKVCGYVNYKEDKPNNDVNVNSLIYMGASLDFYALRYKSVNLYVFIGINYWEDRHPSSYYDYNNNQSISIKEQNKKINSGVGFGIDFIVAKRFVFTLETGYNLVNDKSTNRPPQSSYYYYNNTPDWGVFGDSVFGLGIGISFII